MKLLISCRDSRASALARMIGKADEVWRLSPDGKSLERWNGQEFSPGTDKVHPIPSVNPEFVIAHVGGRDFERLPDLVALKLPTILFSGQPDGATQVPIQRETWSAGVVTIAFPIGMDADVPELISFLPAIRAAAGARSVNSELRLLENDLRKPLKVIAEFESLVANGEEVSVETLLTSHNATPAIMRDLLADPRDYPISSVVRELLISVVKGDQPPPPVDPMPRGEKSDK